MLRGNVLLIKPTIHPYAGIIQIRLEGVISAYTRRHPLIIGCKGSYNFFNSHAFWQNFHVCLCNAHRMITEKLPVSR